MEFNESFITCADLGTGWGEVGPWRKRVRLGIPATMYIPYTPVVSVYLASIIIVSQLAIVIRLAICLSN